MEITCVRVKSIYNNVKQTTRQTSDTSNKQHVKTNNISKQITRETNNASNKHHVKQTTLQTNNISKQITRETNNASNKHHVKQTIPQTSDTSNKHHVKQTSRQTNITSNKQHVKQTTRESSEKSEKRSTFKQVKHENSTSIAKNRNTQLPQMTGHNVCCLDTSDFLVFVLHKYCLNRIPEPIKSPICCAIFFSGPLPKPYLIAVSETKIAVVDLTSNFSTFIIHGNKTTRNLQIDPQDKKMYFMSEKRIYQANFDGSGLEVIYHNERYLIQTFAFDWVRRRMFWVFQNKDGESLPEGDYAIIEGEIINSKNYKYFYFYEDRIQVSHLALDPYVG